MRRQVYTDWLYQELFKDLIQKYSIRLSWNRLFEKRGATPCLHNQAYQERRGHRGTLVPYLGSLLSVYSGKHNILYQYIGMGRQGILDKNTQDGRLVQR